jgi:hypothetical protein
MTAPDKVIDALKANVDKTVTLVFSNGEVVTANLILVDDEGIVYDLIASNLEGRVDSLNGGACWSTFGEIVGVSPTH